jgi:hypothetical protein
VPPFEGSQVEHNRTVGIYDLFDHPPKWNVGKGMFCGVSCSTSSNICQLSAPPQ